MIHGSRSDAINTGISGSQVIVTPAMSAGDVVIGSISQDIVSGTNSALPTAFTALASSPLTSSVDGQVMCCGYKYEAGAPPANYTWTLAGADAVIAQVTISGANPAAPINASTGSASGATAQSGSTVNVPNPGFSLTPAVTNDLIFFGSADWVTPIAGVSDTAPSGFTQLEVKIVTDQFAGMMLASTANQASGATGSILGTSSQSNSTSAGFTAFLIAVDLTAPPLILQQPTSTTINDGDYWYGWVISNNPGTDTYQWQQNTGAGFTNIVGQTSNVYTAAATLHVADSGIQYRCNVTNANGTTASNAATITVQAGRTGSLGEWDPELNIKAWW